MSTVPLALMALILRLLDSRYSPSRQRLVSWLCSMPHNLSSLPGEGSLALCCALCLHLLGGPSSCSPAVSAASACHYAHFLAAQLSALQSVDGVAALLASARARLSGARTEASAAATRLRVREAVLYEEGEGGEEEGAGEQGAMLPPSPPVALFGRVAQLQANCCLAQLLRYSALSLETQGFEGLRACTAAALEEAPSLRALAASMALHAHQPLALRQALAAAAAPAAAPTPAPAVDGALAAPQQPPPPSALRATLQAALAPPTSYSLALSSLTRYYDFGYGTSIGGGSGASGSAGTPLGILLAGVGGPALTPSPRARELLISASSSAPVGGASFSTPAAGGAMGVGESGRQLAHHSVYALARLARAFGRLEEAGEALRECLKAAQGAGDACAASYTLQTLCELGNAAQLGLLGEGEEGEGSGSEQGSPHFTQEALTLLRRIRVRASELGLWRQQAHTSLALARDTFLYSCAAPAAAAAAAAGAGGWSGSASGASASALPPSCLPVPHWFSLDTFTSMRQGGLVCGGFFPGGGEFAAGRLVVTTASGSGAGGGGAGASGASGANPTTPAAAAAAAAAITSTPTTAFSPYLTPTPTASRTLQESLGSTATCALTSPTAAAAAASARLVRAIYQSTGGTPPPPPTGGSASALAAAAAAAATAAGVAATVAAGSSRGASGAPAPLRWEEVLQLQGEGHAARGDMWLGVSGVSAGGAAVGARLLAAAAARCGDVARGAAGGCGGRDWEQGAGEALAGYLAGLFKGSSSSSSSRVVIPLVL